MKTGTVAHRLWVLGGLLALSVGSLAQGPGAAIRGRVDVRLTAPPIERRPNVNELGMHAGHDTTDLRRSVVYLESAPALAFPEVDRQRMSMDQRNETFVPRVVAVPDPHGPQTRTRPSRRSTTLASSGGKSSDDNVGTLSRIRRAATP